MKPAPQFAVWVRHYDGGPAQPVLDKPFKTHAAALRFMEQQAYILRGYYKAVSIDDYGDGTGKTLRVFGDDSTILTHMWIRKEEDA